MNQSANAEKCSEAPVPFAILTLESLPRYDGVESLEVLISQCAKCVSVFTPSCYRVVQILRSLSPKRVQAVPTLNDFDF